MPYPPFRGRRISLREAMAAGGGPVACRCTTRGIADQSAHCPLEHPVDAPEGSWVSGLLEKAGDAWVLANVTVHAPAAARPAHTDDVLPGKRTHLEARARALAATADFFSSRGFLQVETPCRVICPAVEPHLDAFPSEGRFLITSPELHLKRLLAAGYEKIFEIARVFRSGESGRQHLPEFSMVEWYRVWGSLGDLMGDCEALVASLCRLVGKTAPPAPYPRISFRDLFLEAAGIDPLEPGEAGALVGRARELGSDPAPGEDTDELLERIFVHAVEPRIKTLGPVFVTNFPASQAALARISERDGRTAERFELYLDGIELANGFDELNDPAEQRARIRAAASKRRDAGAVVYPEDAAFLAALDSGMPPAAGIALGFDRLLMWLLGAEDIRSVIAFPQ